MVRKGLALAVLSLALAAPAALAQAEAEWQNGADACLTGAARQKYIQSCKDNDQFTAVLACLDGSAAETMRVRGAILKAGRYSVNKYMSKKKPSECK
jgi:hypothetical protein